jgi:hypothetical protein
MSFELTGKLIAKYDTVNVNDKFKKREFVLETTEEIAGNSYTNYAKMQVVQNKCEILDRYNTGDMVKITFNIKGNRWEKDGKVNYITNLDAWKIESASAAPAGGNTQYASAQPAAHAAPYAPSAEPIDDLPF